MTILCIGDSNTWGYDPRSYFGGRYPAEIRWTERLGEHRTVNCGVNGLTVPGSAAGSVELIRSTKPELVVVMLGTNDLLQGKSAEETAARMEAFLAELSEAGAPLLLIAPPPLQRGEWVQDEELIALSRRLAALCRESAERLGLRFADAGAWGVELCFDGVHFSPEGHAAFAKGLSAALM